MSRPRECVNMLFKSDIQKLSSRLMKQATRRAFYVGNLRRYVRLAIKVVIAKA